MPGFSVCRNIVIITIIIIAIVIILEFLSARFVSPGALLPFYLFFTTSKNIRIEKASKFLMSYSFCPQWRQSFQVFKWTAGCIFKCKTTKMKLAKNIKKDF